MTIKNTIKKADKKGKLHTRNLHNGRYDFDALCAASPALKQYVINSPADQLTIDFSEPQSLRALNQALLKYFYHIDFWQIPEGYL